MANLDEPRDERGEETDETEDYSALDNIDAGEIAAGFTLNRVVLLLTPIFTGIAGWLVQWSAEHLPGAPTLDKDELAVLFGLGAISGLGAVLAWIRGHHKDMDNQAAVQIAQAQQPLLARPPEGE